MKYKHLVTAFALVSASGPAMAQGAIDRPYMNRWENAYDSHWENRLWQPSDWVDDGQTVQNVIDGFYNSGIITNQYFSDNRPVVEVGYPFTELSGRDQRRVAEFIAYAFNLGPSDDTMQFVLKNGNKSLGTYSRGMLQLH